MKRNPRDFESKCSYFSMSRAGTVSKQWWKVCELAAIKEEKEVDIACKEGRTYSNLRSVLVLSWNFPCCFKSMHQPQKVIFVYELFFSFSSFAVKISDCLSQCFRYRSPVLGSELDSDPDCLWKIHLTIGDIIFLLNYDEQYY